VIHTVILSDVRLYREGLADVFGREEGLQVVGTGALDPAALALVAGARPDVALVDATGRAALDLVRAIRRESPAVAVVVLAVPELDSAILACAEAGIAGYLTRNGSLAELVDTIRRAARGEAVCPPAIVGHLLRRVGLLAAQHQPAEDLAELTPRELEVVHLLAEGLTNKEIAGRLFISVATVKNHVHNILEKLSVRKRSDVIARVSPRLGHLGRMGGLGLEVHGG
jgi:two-component system nitrate/nitrite response regulator NarL